MKLLQLFCLNNVFVTVTAEIDDYNRSYYLDI